MRENNNHDYSIAKFTDSSPDFLPITTAIVRIARAGFRLNSGAFENQIPASRIRACHSLPGVLTGFTGLTVCSRIRLHHAGTIPREAMIRKEKNLKRRSVLTGKKGIEGDYTYVSSRIWSIFWGKWPIILTRSFPGVAFIGLPRFIAV